MTMTPLLLAGRIVRPVSFAALVAAVFAPVHGESTAGSPPAPAVSVEDGEAVLRFNVPAAAPGLETGAEWSADLNTWHTQGILHRFAPPVDGVVQREVTLPAAEHPGPSAFFRLRQRDFGETATADTGTLSLPHWSGKYRWESNPNHNHPYSLDWGTQQLEDEPRTLETVVIENEYLRVYVLPEIAGSIHRVIHKPTGEDLFFYEGKIKDFLPFWDSGVKVSFPWHEHGTGTGQLASYYIEEAEDGTVSIHLWMEFSRYTDQYNRRMFGRYTNMMLGQTVTLQPGEALVHVAYRALNPAPYPQGARIWNDAFFPREQRRRSAVQGHEPGDRSPSTSRLLFPAAYVSDHDGRDFRMMAEEELAVAHYTELEHNSVFAWNVQDGFAGVHYPLPAVNRLRFTDPLNAPGLKLYVQREGGSGSPGSPFGHMWNFIELWGGTDNVFESPEGWLEAGEIREIAFQYGLTVGIGEIDYGTRHAVLVLDEETGTATVLTFRNRTGLTLRLDGAALAEDLAAGPVAPATIDLGSGGTDGEWILLADGGEELLRFTSPLVPAVDEAANDHTWQYLWTPQTGFQGPEVVQRIGDQELRGNSYRNATTRFPVGSTERGRLQLRGGNLSGAVDTLTARTGNDPEDGAAWYYLGVTRLEQGQSTTARGHFESALAAAQPHAPANYFLALRAIAADRPADAVAKLDALLDARPGHFEAALLRAGLIAAQGDAAPARALLAREPADPRLWEAIARAESTDPESEAAAIRDRLLLEPGAPRRLEEFLKALDDGVYLPPRRIQ